MNNSLERADSPSTKPLLLIVDDVAANLHVLSAELRSSYRIKVALSGEKALEIASHADDPPDLILLDVMMPGMSGFEVLNRLREDLQTAQIPVILVTADTTDGCELRGLDLGARDFLGKPFNVPVMKARVRNLVDQRLARRDAERSRLKLQAMLDSSMQYIALLDLAGRLVHANRAMLEGLALTPGELPNQALWQLTPWPADPARALRVQRAVELASVGLPSRFELAFDVEAKGRVTLNISIRPVAAQRGEAAYVLFEAHDVSDQRQAEDEVRFLVNNDSLTKLRNQIGLAQEVEAALATEHGSLCLLKVELERFGSIRAVFGQEVSDDLMRAVAARIVDTVRGSDTPARIDTASFGLLLPSTEASGAAAVARKLGESLLRPFLVQGHELRVIPLIGMAMAPRDSSSFSGLLNCTEVAIQRTGGGEQGRACFYDAKVQQALTRKLRVETLLRRAIGNQELSLHYQPQIDLGDGRCLGVEALLRWSNPELGAVSPLEFIGVAESSGLIGDLGEWVLAEALSQMSRWRSAGVNIPRVAINLSAIQFQQADIVDKILACLAAHGLPSHCLEIELTESTAFSDPKMALSRLQSMRESGLHVAIDDFGTGYSSLSYLQRIRVDTLKIDRAFVKELGENDDADALMAGMLSMAQALNIKVLAEGVETQEQLEWLRVHDCDAVQGYLIGKPVAAQAIESWLSASAWATFTPDAATSSAAQWPVATSAEACGGAAVRHDDAHEDSHVRYEHEATTGGDDTVHGGHRLHARRSRKTHCTGRGRTRSHGHARHTTRPH